MSRKKVPIPEEVPKGPENSSFTPQIAPAKVETHIDYDVVYFDNGFEPVKEMNDDNDSNRDIDSEEEMPDESDSYNDDGYNGYGGYDEWGNRDRGYYYCNGRRERKTSPMMSP